MKIFYEVLPSWLGRAMYRINKEFKEHAPDWVEFTTDPKSAELQIIDSIGVGSIDYINNKNYILLQHCYITSEQSTANFWLPHWKNAILVESFMNLPELVNSDDFNFIRLPLGVNPKIFYTRPQAKIFTAVTTGYVADTECIGEALKAVQTINGELAHVGGDIFKGAKKYKHYENISDSDLRYLYNSSYYTLGMRRLEGFELPLIEGTLCGSRGIALNYEVYKHWFGDLVEYVEDGDFYFVMDQLINYFSLANYRAVSEKEKDIVRDKFSWDRIAKEFWEKVKNSV